MEEEDIPPGEITAPEADDLGQVSTAASDLDAARSRGRGQFGCRHYRRRVRFITPCCDEEWWCRHCHNEAKYQQEEGNHVCVERAMHQNCPVCFEFLFESVDPTTVLRCGHTIHSQCLSDLERNTSAICPSCPICKKSLGDYSRYWRALDVEVASTPAPQEYQGWQANILCNDCSTSSTVTFSLIAHKCSACSSYNTRRMGIITSGNPLPSTTNEDIGAPPAPEQGDAVPPAVPPVAPIAGLPNFALLHAMQLMQANLVDEGEEGDEDGGGGIGGNGDLSDNDLFEDAHGGEEGEGNGNGVEGVEDGHEDADEEW